MVTRANYPIPDGYHTVTPVLTLDNANQAIDWYKKAFGAREVSRAEGNDGKLLHAELRIGDSPIILSDAIMGGKSAKAFGGSPASLWIYVADSDALFERAVSAGARPASGAMGQMTDQFWGDRSGTFTDPYGYRWTIATRKENLSQEEMKERQAAFLRAHTGFSPNEAQREV